MFQNLKRYLFEYIHTLTVVPWSIFVSFFMKRSTTNAPCYFEKYVEHYLNRTLLVSSEESYTYEEFLKKTNCYTRWAMANNITKGDVIAILAHSHIDTFALSLGIAKRGAIIAFIPTRLEGQNLAAAIDECSSKAVIVDPDYIHLFNEAENYITKPSLRWVLGESPGVEWPRLDTAIDIFTDDPISEKQLPIIDPHDPFLFFISTNSHETPKFVKFSFLQILTIANALAVAENLTLHDRVKHSLPLYNIIPIIHFFACFIKGASYYLPTDYDSPTFWDDIFNEGITIFVYMHEQCRYLLSRPPHPLENQHKLRLCTGLGLSGDIWMEFKTRFRISRLLEIYFSLEGSAPILNYIGKPGSFGAQPIYSNFLLDIKVVKTDKTGKNFALEDTRYIECRPDEPGSLILKINNLTFTPFFLFRGFLDEDQTNDVIIKDVFSPGDRWHVPGDIVSKDKHGYFWFHDSLNDIFTCQGETVKTSQMRNVISAFPNVSLSKPFAVKLPHSGEIACMVAIAGMPNISKIYSYLEEQIPLHHMPLFLRVLSKPLLTDELIWNKLKLQRDGYNPNIVSDPLYVFNTQIQNYIALTPDIYKEIQFGYYKYPDFEAINP